MKTKTSKKASKAQTQTQPAVDKPPVVETKKDETPSYVTSEAWQWLNKWVWAPPKADEKSPEPMAYPALWYVGTGTLEMYSEATGHRLTLNEVQYMVRLDGDEEAVCSGTGLSFIPVTYAAEYIPDDIRSKLQAGVPISEAGIRMRGQFNVIDGTAHPVSGSIYHEMKTPNGVEFDYAYQSCLMLLANGLMIRRRKNYLVWTCVSKESLDERKRESTVRKEIKQRIWAMVEDTETDYLRRQDRRNGKLASMGKAIRNAKPDKRRHRHEQEPAE